jgi:uncharacterized protein YpuA (DUF1002 family)
MVRSRVRSGGRAAAVLAVVAIAVSLLVSVAPASAADKVVVTLGANLSAAQQQEMLDLFKVNRGDVPVIEVTNQEERRYLQGIIPVAQIGTRAISSVYVRVKSDGSGVKVQTKNITYVTEQTYANALVTAGVKDADVYAAAPFDVSGTAALTGVFKAFEEATGKPISEQAKRTATQELVDTAQTGKEVGNQNQVAELMRRAKEQVVSQGLKNPAAIEQVVINISNQLNLTLTQTQIDRLTQVLVQIGQLNINVGTLQQQLKDFQTKIGLSNEQAQGIVQSIKSFFSNLWRSIFGG